MEQILKLQAQANEYHKQGRMMLYNHIIVIINQIKNNLK